MALKYRAQARTLGRTVASSQQHWRSSCDAFATTTAPTLHARLDEARAAIENLSMEVHAAADDADEAGRQMTTVYRLQVKRVIDVIEKMLRKRRRRFRWVRRGMWLGVEWMLVGLMWYVWFVVVILRVIVGVVYGVTRGVRWLLWL